MSNLDQCKAYMADFTEDQCVQVAKFLIRGLVERGIAINVATDAVLGAGTFRRMADEIFAEHT